MRLAYPHPNLLTAFANFVYTSTVVRNDLLRYEVMKWPKTKITENEGLLYIKQVVNAHGSIFREIHQEEDIGVDGVIEFVKDGEASGLLLAIQVKSGDSYLADDRDRFIIPVDETHIEYWQRFMLPVVLICYSPSRKLAAWQAIKEYIQYQSQRGKVSIKRIEVPFINVFNVQALNEELHGLALKHVDERFLFKFANMLLSNNAYERREGMLQLLLHPASRATRLTAFMASQLILDENLDAVRLAASALGYCVAHRKWSFYPDSELMWYAWGLCSKFDERHVRRLMEVVEDGDFGPKSLGEACLDCIGCMWAPDAENALRRIADDRQHAIQTRANALFVLYGCNWDALKANSKSLHDIGLGDLIEWMIGDVAD